MIPPLSQRDLHELVAIAPDAALQRDLLVDLCDGLALTSDLQPLEADFPDLARPATRESVLILCLTYCRNSPN